MADRVTTDSYESHIDQHEVLEVTTVDMGVHFRVLNKSRYCDVILDDAAVSDLRDGLNAYLDESDEHVGWSIVRGSR